MANEETLIQFKTDAWKSSGMVAGYAQRMHENRGTNRLKNHLEVSLCRENVTGSSVIDVGIGTGRGSLPLAKDGYQVTGVDVSQAMLDQCKREAGGVPIELLEGDLSRLPVNNDQFDSLISLNVAVHFPNWRHALKDWARVVKPGGRVIFDVHSLDHLIAVSALAGCEPDELLTPGQRTDPSQFMLRITARELADAAKACGLSIRRIVPYGAILGGGNVNYWLRDSRLWGYLGDRALSWMAVDNALFEFGVFLERGIIANLSTHSTGRFMAVLEKCDDDAMTRDALTHHERVAAAFEETPRLEQLQTIIGEAVTHWSAQLRAHLEYAQNRTLLAMALSGPWAAALRPLIVDLAGEDLATSIYDAHERQSIDEEVYRFIQSWYDAPGMRANLEYKGVALGPVLEYELMQDILREEFFAAKERA